ncbi:glycine dehydrogenase [Rozella allomycis CSF55]|uniref:Glycine cleavage system P protein n=1 Tax=Rozella allomycis (strain CSF55) TaxID=988480 RepID=A0A4P9YE69_ROZAC|nr:glycine dehydrogenase [Rozella allomycis CSF55]
MVIPSKILSKSEFDPENNFQGVDENELLKCLDKIMDKNKVFRSFIGMGYSNCHTPKVILRNIMENPAWYTQYTPYQPEISQGRLESLLNFQTMVCDLTGLPVANASLLDEGTAAAEAMNVFLNSSKNRKTFIIDVNCHPQTIACVKTRAEPLGVTVLIKDFVKEFQSIDFSQVFGVLIQYPDTHGKVCSINEISNHVHENGAFIACATDLLSLTLLEPPGRQGCDIAFGNSQRFGVPLGYGGPHAAFFAVKDNFKRKMPGRFIGVSKDSNGNVAYRLTLQTREQHIKREKATSNICTSQALLANMAAMYAVYHGPKGLKEIALKVHKQAVVLYNALKYLGLTIENDQFFDTIKVEVANVKGIKDRAEEKGINFKYYNDSIGISLDETTMESDLRDILSCFANESSVGSLNLSIENVECKIPKLRPDDYLQHPVFNTYHSETEITRYIHRLQSKDLSLVHSMIPLGSCTMKLNATAEMIPVTWPKVANIHPFVPDNQALGYHQMIKDLEDKLAYLTGFDGVSVQPNSGAQGEYAGLMTIREYHKNNGHAHRNICLIPVSAHGTNPASAAMSGFQVVPILCDSNGNLDLKDLKSKAEKHKENLGAMMITYPSTFGVFENTLFEAISIVHGFGGQVYMDGANMNAQVGIVRPGDLGFDVCHLNLHKTFCIPHGGGGPGMGPICVKKHLIPFLPSHPMAFSNNKMSIGPVSASPYGSSSILNISWCYLHLMGFQGLKLATQYALLNANYLASCLKDYYRILYSNERGFVAHEFIVDCRPFFESSGIEAIDIAKRLQDYGFHSPTMSWPVANTLMIEPTESESKKELDRLIEAMVGIRREIEAIERGVVPKDDNVLVHAPHTIESLIKTDWNHSYTRDQAAYPVENLKRFKFWPSVGRVDDAFGDRNVICTCPPVTDYK